MDQKKILARERQRVKKLHIQMRKFLAVNIRHQRFELLDARSYMEDMFDPPHKDWLSKINAYVDEEAHNLGYAKATLLSAAARGHTVAMEEILRDLEDTINGLDLLADRNPDFVRSFARKRKFWPVLGNHHPVLLKMIKNRFKALEVASECGWEPGMKWGIGWGGKISLATLYAIRIKDILERNAANGRLNTGNKAIAEEKAAWRKWPQWARDCLTLPSLTKQTARLWLEVGWQGILEATGNKPEYGPGLILLAEESRAGKYARRYSKSVAGRVKSAEVLHRKVSPPDTALADIRARIKERIGQALVSLAPR
jgi:hypothetical protein